MPSAPNDVTQLLMDWGKGNPQALDGLMPLGCTGFRQRW